MSDLSRWICTILLLIFVGVNTSLLAEEPIRFGRDVLPILSTNCFACHGPDESVRKANLRLDLESDAKGSHDGGIPVVPGDTVASMLLQRISSTDPDVVMPPPDSHKDLKPEQIEVLRRWISEGAKWGRHWSFEPLERPLAEVVRNDSPIDLFVGNALARKGLALGR